MLLLVLVVAVAGLASSLVRARPAQSSVAPASADSYRLSLAGVQRVEIRGDQAGFSARFAPDEDAALIVASLGESSATYDVSLRAEVVERDDDLALSEVPAFHIARLPFRKLADGKVAGRKPATSMLREVVLANGGSGGAFEPRSERRFYLHVTDGPLDDARNYARVTARLILEGAGVRVYLDAQQSASELSPGLPEEVVRWLDHDIIARSRELLGLHADCDGDGKLAVLLTPWLGKLQGGRTTIRGCVRSSDFRRSIPAPFSNQADVLYLNSNLQPDATLKTLLAHEYTHAVCFSRRLAVPRGSTLPEEDDWLNEGLAHLAENVHRADWSNLDYRVAQYLQNPSGYPLVVSDYFGAGLWRDHGCRGATYLFLRWCVDQAGEGLLPSLLEAPGRGTPNLEYATGVPFEELFRHWTIAVWRSRPGAPVETGSTIPREAAFQSINLCGALGTVRLNGPHAEEWNLGTEPQRVSLRGTSAAYVRLRSPDAAWRRIRVIAPVGTRLQLTLVRSGAAL